MEGEEKEKKVMKAHCPYCDRKVNCTVEWQQEKLYQDEYEKISTRYSVFQCCGCDDFFFKIFEDYHREDENDDPVIADHIHPLPKSQQERSHRTDIEIRRILASLEPKGWIFKDMVVEDSFDSQLYLETCTAVNQDNVILAAMGLRTLIDDICKEKTQTDGNFEENLQSLRNADYLTGAAHELLKSILNIGNSAAHRKAKVKTEDLVLCLKSLEHLVEAVFIVPQRKEQIGKVSKALPPKPSKKSKTAAP